MGTCGCVGADAEGGAGGATPDLQAVCDVGNHTDTRIGFGDQDIVPDILGRWWWRSDGGSTSCLGYFGIDWFCFATGTSGFRPAMNGTQDIGIDSRRWRRGHFNHQAGGVAVVGDASFLLDDETFVDADTGAVGTNTLTLPIGGVGWWYIINCNNTGAGIIALDDQPGDTINGGAGPIPLFTGAMTGRSVWLVFKQTATNWVAKPITDLGV